MKHGFDRTPDPSSTCMYVLTYNLEMTTTFVNHDKLGSFRRLSFYYILRNSEGYSRIQRPWWPDETA
jgi:hypothetical protein